MQMTAAIRNALLEALTATDAPLDPAATFLGVGTAITQSGLNTQLSDITQATGAMATRQAVTTWSNVFTLSNGTAYQNAPLKTFAPASASEAQTLTCWFIADALTAGNLIAFGLINPPIPLPDENSSWSIVLRVTLDPNAQWSAEITFDG